MTKPLTPESLAKLREQELMSRCYSGGRAICIAPDELIALLDAAARLAEVEAERDALAAKVARVRDECVRGYGYAGWLALARPVLRILDGTSAHCDRGPCHLPRGHGGPCNPGGDALDATETDHA